MRLSSEEKNTLWNVGRWSTYFAILMFSVFGLWYFAAKFKTETFEEYGIIENIQLSLLFLTSISFFLQAFKKAPTRPLCVLFSALCLAAFCRELDAWFDDLWPLGWQFALLFPVIALGYVAFHLKDFRKSVVDFCCSPAFFLMYCAAIIILPVAQCIGHKSFFVDALGTATNARAVRRLFEESCEYIGYTLMFLSSIEFYVHSHLMKRK